MLATSAHSLLTAGALALLAATAPAQDTPVHTWNGTFVGDQWGDCTELLGDVDGDGVRDVDGDGHDDVLVGASGGDGHVPDSGTVELRSGADGSLLHEFKGFQKDSWFGAALATGDMDGDGKLDVAIGAPWFDLDDTSGAYREEGYVHVYRLTDNAVISTQPGTTFTVGLFSHYHRKDWGGDLAYAGDTDGDGFGELLVAAAWSDYTNGLTQADFMRTGFVQRVEPATGQLMWHQRGGDDELLGARIAVLGDADGDGELDVAAGSTGANGNLGRVTVWSGSTIKWTVEGNALRPVGNALAAVEDATGDGRADLLLGASQADKLQIPFPLDQIGLVELRAGNDGALVHTWWGEQAGEEFGREVAAGRLTGEGFDALIMAAPERDIGGADDSEGVVLLYDPVTVEASWALYGDGLAGSAGVPSISAPADPVIGSAFTVQVGNASQAPATGYLFLGLAPQSLPVKGGTLLVDALVIQAFPLPKNGRELSLPVALDYSLAGFDVFVQVLHTDPGAPKNVAFTRGLKATLGD